jgi:hypothetical protein
MSSDSAMISTRSEVERVILQHMRDNGYIPVLDIDPAFSVSYNEQHDRWFFKITIHGIYVGKRKSWKYEGVSNGKFMAKPLVPDK